MVISGDGASGGCSAASEGTSPLLDGAGAAPIGSREAPSTGVPSASWLASVLSKITESLADWGTPSQAASSLLRARSRDDDEEEEEEEEGGERDFVGDTAVRSHAVSVTLWRVSVTVGDATATSPPPSSLASAAAAEPDRLREPIKRGSPSVTKPFAFVFTSSYCSNSFVWTLACACSSSPDPPTAPSKPEEAAPSVRQSSVGTSFNKMSEALPCSSSTTVGRGTFLDEFAAESAAVDGVSNRSRPSSLRMPNAASSSLASAEVCLVLLGTSPPRGGGEGTKG